MHKIYINGASGKMGRSVLKLIKEDNEFVIENFLNSDVVIDFSNPISTIQILIECVKNKKHLIKEIILLGENTLPFKFLSYVIYVY